MTEILKLPKLPELNLATDEELREMWEVLEIKKEPIFNQLVMLDNMIFRIEDEIERRMLAKHIRTR